MNQPCFHCAEPILTGEKYQAEIFGISQRMCCPGCEAIAKAIVQNGLSAYYQYRNSAAEKPALIPASLRALQLYDNPDIQAEFVVCDAGSDAGTNDVLLSIDGISCAACAWLIETRLSAIDGVLFIHVNSITHRATVRWDSLKIKLSVLLHHIQAMGFTAAPFEADSQEQYYRHTIKQYLYKLGIAGLAMMQIMMLAIAMYFDVLGDMDDVFTQYFRWVSLFLATPVICYSASPFYLNAWQNIKAKTVGMDVPVSLALLFCYFASLYATVTGAGEVYFESIAMFTFFLLLGRFLEMRARRLAAAASTHLLSLIPRLATLTSGRRVPVNSLDVGHLIQVLPGESFPADGTIEQGDTSVNESMLTGEFMPVSRHVGDGIFAGTQNIDGNVVVKVSAKKQQSLLSHIIRLQESAQHSKPRVLNIADTISRYFVAIILVIAAVTWGYWHFHRPEDAFWIMLSVLVATCPCALSLATPTAITCATSTLHQWGILLRRGHVFETLTKINHVIIDKTGTLTQGKVVLVDTQLFSDLDKQQVLAIASELESVANHPISNAFTSFSCSSKKNLSSLKNVMGKGVIGFQAGHQWRIGHPEFALYADGNCQRDTLLIKNPLANHHQICLSKDGALVASFQLSDPLRPSSAAFIAALTQANIKVTMLTGDNEYAATTVAEQLGIKHVVFGVSPQGKIDFLKAQPTRDIILMIGDGINDTPILAGAHLSVAMGSATDAAKRSADLVLLGNKLSTIIKMRKLAFVTRRIIAQNIAWAIGYNLIILPLAVSGWVAPYIAVIGMSASSLLVVTNSFRLYNSPRKFTTAAHSLVKESR